jgi:hypothetical protein
MDIAFKINWIGIYPTKYNSTCNGQSVLHVTFSKFCLYEEKGPFVKQIAPNLYKYMYDIDRRVVMSHSLPLDVYEDVLEILKLAEKCPPSKRLLTTDKEIKKCR